MLTKEDLDRARDLLTEIVKKNNRLAVMHSRVTGKAITYHEKVQESVNNSQEALLACMADLEKELDADRKELKGYQLDEDSIRRYQNPVTGLEHLEYQMIALDPEPRLRRWKKGRKARPETYIRIDDLRDQEKELGEEDCTWEMC